MKLMNKQSFIFQNRGIPHENNLNIIGLTLSSRKIQHDIPISIDFDPHAYAKACGSDSEEVMIDTQELWNISDGLGLKYRLVKAKVQVMPRQYRIEFYCYDD